MRVMICGQMGSGKSLAAQYLVESHGAVRWSRSEAMKRLSHALIDRSGDPESILARVLPDPVVRDRVRDDLLAFVSTYVREEGKPRRLYQEVAQRVMDADPLAFERELWERIEAAGPAALVLIDDVRSLAAFDFFRAHGFSGIRIHADDEVRRARLRARDGALPAAETMEHISERECLQMACSIEIANNEQDAPALFQALDDAIRTPLPGAR